MDKPYRCPTKERLHPDNRATYLAQKKNLNLVILVEGEKALLNIYQSQVNPEKFQGKC